LEDWDIKDKKILITGSTDGIGLETARQLTQKGAEVIIHGRNQKKADLILDKWSSEGIGTPPECFIADFSSLNSVKVLSNKIHKKYNLLDVLINNAGVYQRNYKKTKDGFEMSWGVNHLAHFYLTLLLLDVFKIPSSSRIVTVASMAHSSSMEWDNLNAEQFYDGYDAYSRSKLANILFAFELADKVKNTKITSNCLHPGVINTKLLAAGWGGIGNSVTKGAKNVMFVAADPYLIDKSGYYFVNQKSRKPAKIAYNKSAREKLWDISLKMTGLDEKILAEKLS